MGNYDQAQRPASSIRSDSDPSSLQQAEPGNQTGARAGTYFLGRYRVVDEIGIGGMASVHLARMDGPGGFQKWVAIKRIHPHLVEDDSFVHMFLDEARVAARISHPNVATVFELGKHEDTYWIAMEYLHGEPLREVMRRTEELGQPMPPEIACRVIADAAEGLHAAHELLGKNGEKLGLVHRDVTPHNLFVTYDGTTKVVDFGIAKFSSRMASTRAGTLKGKLAYMSPEQVAGEAIDRRTDLFALGVVLWELTTGQRLFRMESDLDTLAKVQECNIPRPTSVVRGYPIDLEKIVLKALARNKNERYRTAREFSRALQSLLMRRGLFIASDEVAGYIQSIFQDRIRKREAHLRWAAEVTQTIALDGEVSTQEVWNNPEGSIGASSDVQQHPSQQMPPAPRPAAGMPPQPVVAHQSNPQLARPATVPYGAPPSFPVPSQVSTQRQADKGPAVPRPGMRPDAVVPAPDSVPEDHPALAEAPTVRATPEMRDAIMAGAEFEEDFDDSDDTIVTTTRPDMNESPVAPSSVPLPAAGRPASMPMQTQSPYGQPIKKTLQSEVMPPLDAYAPTQPRSMPIPQVPATVASGAMGMPHSGPQQSMSPVSPTRPAPLPEGPPHSMGNAPPSMGNPYSQQQMMLRQQSMSSEYIDPLAQGMGNPGAVEVQRLFAPPPRMPDGRTVTAQALRRRIPLWLVAVLSAVVGLIAFAIGLFIVTHLPVGRSDEGPAQGTTANPAVPGKAGGPFGAARSAFATAIGAPSAPRPSTELAPPTTGDAPATTVAAIDSPPPLAAAMVAPKPPSTSTASPVAALPPGSGWLSVRCSPACDEVDDNGSPIGQSPVRRAVPVGSRRVTLVWSNPTQRKVIAAVVTSDRETEIYERRP